MKAYILPESGLQCESRSNVAPRRWKRFIYHRRFTNAVARQTKSKEVNSVGATEQSRRPRELLSTAAISIPTNRAFSQAKKVIEENQGAFNKFVLRSLSYTAISIEPEYFARVDKSLLAKLVRKKMCDQLHQFGGAPGVFSMLKSDKDNGIEADTQGTSSRRQSFGSNTTQMPSAKMSRTALATLKDPTFVLVLLIASLSLGFSIKRDERNVVSDAVFIIVSLFIVMAAICLSNTWVMRQLHLLSKSNNSISTVVIRDGRKQQIPPSDVVVGDLVYLQIGDQVPADGLLVEESLFQVNESCLTCDPNSVKLPFLLSGSKVTNGYARMLVTAVGMDTTWGEMMSSKCLAEIKTPLQVKLHKLTWNTTMVGLAVASMVLIVKLIQYFTGNMKDKSGAVDYTSSKSIHHVFQDITGILVASIFIALTIPEGLQLAVTICLAHSAKITAIENVIVRNLAAFEKIGLITAMCVDRSSTVSPKVEEFWLGRKNSSMKHRCQLWDAKVLQLIYEGIRLNTTSGSCSELDEIQTEKAIHAWVDQEIGTKIAELKGNCVVLDADGNLQKKQGLIRIKRNGDNRVHVHMNGSIDTILVKCSHYYEDNGEVHRICNNARKKFVEVAKEMENNGLRCIAYAHSTRSIDSDDNANDLTLIGFLGLRVLSRPNISKALTECQQAGVKVIMITTEGFPKARESALECSIFSRVITSTSDEIIEGEKFREMADDERLENVEKISVIAGACISDKLLLVQCLKQKGHTVAVIGGFPGDEKVFEEADVNVFPGTQESQLMKEKSDIIISDGSFTTIASAVRRARGMRNNIQILVQFQLIITITSLVTDSVTTIFEGEPPNINIVAAISSGRILFAALQMLWVKLIVGTLVVLALSIDDPAESLVQLTPVNQTRPFITNIMWRDIIGQSLSQIVILLTIQFKGESTFKLTAREKDTLIFNILVLCQIFNLFNRVKGKNFFEILTKKRIFWMVIGIIIILQVVIVELLKMFAGTERLNWKQWRGCIGIAIICWLIGCILRKIPVPEEPFFCCLCDHKAVMTTGVVGLVGGEKSEVEEEMAEFGEEKKMNGQGKVKGHQALYGQVRARITTTLISKIKTVHRGR